MKRQNLLFLLVSALTITSLYSCSHNFSGYNSPAAYCNVRVSNPEFGTPIGFPNDNSGAFNPGFEVEITVNTLDGNNQATYYSTQTIQVTHASMVSNGAQSSFYVPNVKVPSGGAFVIQYQLRSLDCTWPQTQGCSVDFSRGGSASRKYYKDQQTFTGGNPGQCYFSCSTGNKYNEVCC